MIAFHNKETRGGAFVLTAFTDYHEIGHFSATNSKKWMGLWPTGDLASKLGTDSTIFACAVWLVV